MLASMTSLGERSRGRRWWLTYSWFALGATAGGMALAAGLIAIRYAASPIDVSVSRPIGCALAVAIGVLVLRGVAPPTHERQVDHRWLNTYRGWVVGLGFGFQLGTGAMTRISSFAYYLLMICAGLGAPIVALIAAGLVYGGIRAASAWPGRYVRTPTDLQRLTRVIARFQRPVGQAGRVLDGAASVALAAALVPRLF